MAAMAVGGTSSRVFSLVHNTPPVHLEQFMQKMSKTLEQQVVMLKDLNIQMKEQRAASSRQEARLSVQLREQKTQMSILTDRLESLESNTPDPDFLSTLKRDVTDGDILLRTAARNETLSIMPRAQTKDDKALREVAELRAELTEALQQVASLTQEKLDAEARAFAAEARAAAAETAAEEALLQAQQLRSSQAVLSSVLDNIREAIKCPIQHGLPRMPVVASDGQTYERKDITDWLLKGRESPVTHDPLEPKLFPNHFAEVVLEHLRSLGLLEDEEDTVSAIEEMKQGNPPLLKATRTLTEDPADPLAPDYREVILAEEETASMSLLQNHTEQVDVNGKDLHLAIRNLLPEVAMAILLTTDTDGVNAKDWSGSTALHLAAARGLFEICQAIVSRTDFMQLQATDNFGRTAKQLAQDYGRQAVALFLEEAEPLP